ncbi:MAG: alpha/beta hydrolase fold domain-containing protein [Sulfuritalea sp.]|nr:alpha/beta hydrolase fold domain-containing protein [Sulfuritalea sp.]
MSILRRWKAKAVRFVFDHFILTKIGYPVDGLGESRDEERILPTAAGPVRALIHRPAKGEGALPVFVNIHGGGFVFGLPEHDAVFCRRTAKPLLTPGLMNLFNDCYLPRPALATDPRVSPLLAPLESLRGLPPALVITAEYDVLRDEGDAYAARLMEAGVAVRHEVYPGADHAFSHIGPKAPADAAWVLMEDCLRQAFQPN